MIDCNTKISELPEHLLELIDLKILFLCSGEARRITIQHYCTVFQGYHDCKSPLAKFNTDPLYPKLDARQIFSGVFMLLFLISCKEPKRIIVFGPQEMTCKKDRCESENIICTTTGGKKECLVHFVK